MTLKHVCGSYAIISMHKYGAFQISKNPENNNILRRSRGSHKLTDYMNCIGNIKASNSEID